MPGRFDGHHHCRPPLDDSAERATEIAALQLTLAAANGRTLAAQDLVEAQRKLIIVLEAALRDAQDHAGAPQRGADASARTAGL